MKKFFVLILLCTTLFSCKKGPSVFTLEDTIWMSNMPITITIPSHSCDTTEKGYCEECYGWKTDNTNSALYYVFRASNFGYYASHRVEYWNNTEGAPYHNYPDKHSIVVYGISYDCNYPNLYIFHSINAIREFTSIDEAMAFMKVGPLNVSEYTLEDTPRHYTFYNNNNFDSYHRY